MPLSALQFAASDSEDGIHPFSVVARSFDPVEHWYWGRIVHDFAGMQLSKNSIYVDWNHSDEVVGFANSFSVGEAGLECAGSLVSIAPNDKADEIYRKGSAGVPYELSIDFVGPDLELEFLPEGVSTEVNGRQFAGPGYVARRWPLRALAFCRYGVDSGTAAQFSEGESAADVVSVAVFSAGGGEGDQVTKNGAAPAETETVNTEEGAPAAGAAGGAVAGGTAGGGAGAVGSGALSLDTVRQFSAEFGPKGTEFLLAGLSLDAARYQFALHERDEARGQLAKANETISAKDAEIKRLGDSLRQFGANLGQADPLETGGTGSDPGSESGVEVKRLSLAIGDNRAKFAAGMKLRGKS